jgi:hypothetical protein
MEEELKRPGIIPARRMELLRCICELGAELARQTESIAKLITSRPTPGSHDASSSDTQSVSDIMSELVNGRKRRL